MCHKAKKADNTTDKDFVCDEICTHVNIIADTKSKMHSDDISYKTAELFKIFGDKTRLKILDALSVNELCVCDIADILGMTISAISHQLRILKTVNLIKQRRDGKSILYSLADEHVEKLIATGIEHVTE